MGDVTLFSHFPTCFVCSELLEDGLCTTECGHLLHKDCLMKWVQRQATCPYCRKPLVRSNIRDVFHSFHKVPSDQLSSSAITALKDMIQPLEDKLKVAQVHIGSLKAANNGLSKKNIDLQEELKISIGNQSRSLDKICELQHELNAAKKRNEELGDLVTKMSSELEDNAMQLALLEDTELSNNYDLQELLLKNNSKGVIKSLYQSLQTQRKLTQEALAKNRELSMERLAESQRKMRKMEDKPSRRFDAIEMRPKPQESSKTLASTKAVDMKDSPLFRKRPPSTLSRSAEAVQPVKPFGLFFKPINDEKGQLIASGPDGFGGRTSILLPSRR